MSQIYNGSFLLGGTSATTLSAGPGIKLDTSVPGTIKISEDRTVLYDNYTGRPANIGGQITLSESPLNFEYVDVYLNGSSPDGFSNISNGYEKIPNIQLSSTNSLEFVKLFAANNTTEGVHEVGCGYSGISGTTWTKWFGYVTNVNFTGAARKAEFGNPTHLNIWRVIGINRKEV